MFIFVTNAFRIGREEVVVSLVLSVVLDAADFADAVLQEDADEGWEPVSVSMASVFSQRQRSNVVRTRVSTGLNCNGSAKDDQNISILGPAVAVYCRIRRRRFVRRWVSNGNMVNCPTRRGNNETR